MSDRRFRFAVLLTCLLIVVARSRAISPARTSHSPAPAAAANDRFAGLQFRNIGPATMGGRVDDLAVLESQSRRSSTSAPPAAACGRPRTWERPGRCSSTTSTTPSRLATSPLRPNDANTVWVGTGENNNRQSGSWGNGVYKSIDGGQTFKHMGLRDSKHIARIIVDPIDHDVVYVAALGSLWGPGKERGVFKTTDGGLTWTNVLFVNEDTGATELVQDPSNNKVLYAATYQRRRATWGFNGGGPGSAHLQVERRRPHLDEADQRHSQPGRLAASAWTSIAPIRTSSTPASSIRPRAAPTARTMPA